MSNFQQQVKDFFDNLNTIADNSGIYVFDGHKLGFHYLFEMDKVKNSNLHRQVKLPANEYSCLELAKKLDNSDKIGLYNVSSSNSIITVKVIITDETLLTATDFCEDCVNLIELI